MPSASQVRRYETFRDVLQTIGEVAPERILLDPAPGAGTEQDVLERHARTKRLYELVDGVLVEKLIGLKESVVAAALGRLLGNFVEEHDLGLVAGEAGMLRLTTGLVRIPAVSFISWRQLPERVCPEEPIPGLVPDLAVEVLSAGNTTSEMARKLRDYFFHGVRLVWFIDPPGRSATVYGAPDQSIVLSEEEALDGGDVLPGFGLPLQQVFAHLTRPAKAPPGKKQGSRKKPRLG